MFLTATKLGPALAAGNTVCFKPSEHVPLTGKLLAECFEAALPDGVLVTVLGAGETGAALVAVIWVVIASRHLWEGPLGTRAAVMGWLFRRL